MAAGTELLAVMNAAVQSLRTEEGVARDERHSDTETSGIIFSPLPAKANYSSAKVETPVHERASPPAPDTAGLSPILIHDNTGRPSAPIPTQASQEDVPDTFAGTPSPMTISARVIEAVSLDFTELATGPDPSTATQSPSDSTSTSETLQFSMKDARNLSKGKENVVSAGVSCSTLPLVSSPASGPIKVKVSTRKLREIQPPSLSPRPPGTHYGIHDGSFLSLGSVSTSSTPKALTPPGATTASTTVQGKEAPGCPTVQGDSLHKHLRTGGYPKTVRTLRQGVLNSEANTASHPPDSPEDSVILTSIGLQHQAREVRTKLLGMQTQDSIEQNGCHGALPQVVYLIPQSTPSVSSTPEASRPGGTDCLPDPGLTQLPGDMGTKGAAFPVFDLTEVTKLVSSCAAAAAASATSTALASRNNPSRAKAGVLGPTQAIQDPGPSRPQETNINPLTEAPHPAHVKFGRGSRMPAGVNTTRPGVLRKAQVLLEARRHQGQGHQILHREQTVDGNGEMDSEQTIAPAPCSKKESLRPAIIDDKVYACNSQSRATLPSHHLTLATPSNREDRREGTPCTETPRHSVPSGSQYSHAQGADVLKRLQRLEELQHLKSVEQRKDTQSSQQGLHHQFSGSSASAQGAERREEGKQERVTENGRSGSLRVPETSAFERNGSLGAPETSAFERNGSLGVPEMSAFERNGRLKETEMSAFERKENIQISQTSVVVSEASKVLSKVQQARESFELRCALQELETSHVPMERLARPPVDSDTPKYLDTWRDQICSPDISQKVNQVIADLDERRSRDDCEKEPSGKEGQPVDEEDQGGRQQMLRSQAEPAVWRKGIKGGEAAARRRLGASVKPAVGKQMPKAQFKKPGNAARPGRRTGRQKASLVGAENRRSKQSGDPRPFQESLDGAPESFHDGEQSAAEPGSWCPPTTHRHGDLWTCQQPSSLSYLCPSYPLLHSSVGAQSVCVHPAAGQPPPPPPTAYPHMQPQTVGTAIPLCPPRVMSSLDVPYLTPVYVTGAAGQPKEAEEARRETVDACLQTSGVFASASEGFVPTVSPSRLIMQTLPGVDIGGESSTPPPQSPLPSESEEEERGDVPTVTHGGEGISLHGHHGSLPSPAYEGPMFPPRPPQNGVGGGAQGAETLSSEELDQRVRERLEEKATEWVQQELLARTLAQLNLPRDPITPSRGRHRHNDSVNSCSTCTPPPPSHDRDVAWAPLLGEAGLQLFVDSGLPVDQQLLERMVREAILEQVTTAIGTTLGTQQGRGGEGGSMSPEEELTFSYTPAVTGSAGSGATSPSLLPTPQPTPSPSTDHTPTSLTPTLGRKRPLSTPVATPTRSQSYEELDREPLETPQATEDETSSMMESASQPGLKYATPSSVQHTPQSVPTPVTTPTPEPVSLGSPPHSPLENEAITPQDQPATSKPVLSETLSSSSTGVPDHSQTFTTTSTNDDREISMGECVRQRPRGARVANVSLSEGEVPLSPGDARWYALHANKLGEGGGVRRRCRDKDRGGADETMQAFIDLKSTPEPTSDSSEFSDSLQSESKLLSVGERKKPKAKAHPSEPFDKFLSKLFVSTPEDTSTPTTSRMDDDTLSEMPSIANSVSAAVPGQPKGSRPEATPFVAARHPRKKLTVPYHQQFALQRPGLSSPGEASRRPVQHSRRPHDSSGEITVSYSEGEAPRILVRDRLGAGRKVGVPVQRSAPSPGELCFSNETRGGIDVISISNRSHSHSLLGSALHPHGSHTHPRQRASDNEAAVPTASAAEKIASSSSTRNVAPLGGSGFAITETAPDSSEFMGGHVQLIRVQSSNRTKSPASLVSGPSSEARPRAHQPHTDSSSKEKDGLQPSDLETEELPPPTASHRVAIVAQDRRLESPGAAMLQGERRPLPPVTVLTAEQLGGPQLSSLSSEEGTSTACSSEFDFSSPLSFPGLD